MISHGKNVKVFCANANRPFAEGVCRKLWLPLGDCTVTTFADGEVSLTINESVRGSDVFLVQSTCKPVNNNLMELLIMIDACRRASAGRITAVIPYFGYARIIEHKHFEFGSTEPGTKTVISREYSAEWKPGDEPYYPVNDDKNSALYAKYKALADAEPHVVFGGRLGEYKYYDMDKVIESALACVAVQMDKINQYKA